MRKRHPKIKSIINKSEIARRLKLTPQYVGQLLSGKRTNAMRLKQISEVVNSELHRFSISHKKF